MNPSTAAATTSTASGVSLFDALLGASPVVMLVLLLLVAFSVLTWAVILSKWKALRSAASEAEEFLQVFWSGKSMDFIFTEAKKLSVAPPAKLFQAGYIELQKLIEKERQKKEPAPAPTDAGSWTAAPEGSIGNIERALMRANRNESQRLEKSLGFLATTGSTAPFIGLFGTVWGIMNSFQSIGAEGGANLAVVAPGIAEALIATAVGLACAIPAVMGYNFYSQQVRSMRTQMENFAGDFLNIVRRNFLTR